MKPTFLELNQSSMETLGFWSETHKGILIHTAEQRYTTEVLKEWAITDIIINGDKVLYKWHKRIMPLTATELKDKYGREL